MHPLHRPVPARPRRCPGQRCVARFTMILASRRTSGQRRRCREGKLLCERAGRRRRHAGHLPRPHAPARRRRWPAHPCSHDRHGEPGAARILAAAAPMHAAPPPSHVTPRRAPRWSGAASRKAAQAGAWRSHRRAAMVTHACSAALRSPRPPALRHAAREAALRGGRAACGGSGRAYACLG